MDGIRGDMVANRSARALVALEGRAEVQLSDVARILGLSLNHRNATLCHTKYKLGASVV